jgi:hypothetical protein
MKKSFLLSMCMLMAYSFNVLAQEQFTFTMKEVGSYNVTYFGVRTDAGGSFTVDWGDGGDPESINAPATQYSDIQCKHNYGSDADPDHLYTVTVTSSGDMSFTKLTVAYNQGYNATLYSLDVTKRRELRTLDCKNNGYPLTALDLTQNSSLTYLDVDGTPNFPGHLTSLDLSANPSLTTLYCVYNQITSLNGLDKETTHASLTTARVNNNHLTLSQLYKLQNVSTTNANTKQLGPQSIYLRAAVMATIDLPEEEKMINGTETEFAMFDADNVRLMPGDDYISLGAGKVQFPNAGEYKITMQNAKITQWSNYDGGKVIVTAYITVVEPNTDAYLENLEVSAGTLTPAFDRNEPAYTVNVGNDVTEITITAIPSDANATVTGDGTFPLAVGENELTVTVTAEDGTTEKEYVITVTRAKSSDATLAILTVNPGALTTAFHPDTVRYAVSVGQEIDSITIEATATHSKAVVTGAGKFKLHAGANPFSLTVTAEDETSIKEYAITVTRAGSADLATLTVTPGTLSPAFSADTTSYKVSVGNGIDSITIAATPVDPNATVTGTGKFPLAVGSNNVFTVTVTAGTAKNYVINVTRGSGIPSYGKTELEVYPNPTTGELKIKNYELKDENIVIFDVMGRTQSHSSVIRHETGEAVINISHLPAGIYFMQIGNQTVKVMKE